MARKDVTVCDGCGKSAEGPAYPKDTPWRTILVYAEGNRGTGGAAKSLDACCSACVVWAVMSFLGESPAELAVRAKLRHEGLHVSATGFTWPYQPALNPDHAAAGPCSEHPDNPVEFIACDKARGHLGAHEHRERCSNALGDAQRPTKQCLRERFHAGECVFNPEDLARYA